MKNKKVVFVTIIILLCIFVPLTAVGLIFRDDKNLLDENPGHDLYYKGKIWFYDNDDKLLSNYECQTEICELTVPTIDDGTYGINYYKEGTLTRVPIEDDKFTFITDGAVIRLFDVSTGKSLVSYKGVKNYSTKLNRQAYIIKNSNGLWGVLSVSNVLSSIIPFEYDFIGLVNSLNADGTLNTDKFIVLKDSKWFIIDANNSAISGYIDDPIIDYTHEYIFSKNNERVRIFSFQNYEYLINFEIKNYILEDKYIGIVTEDSLYIYENLGVDYIKSVSLTNVTGEITLEKAGDILNVKTNTEIIESIELA